MIACAEVGCYNNNIMVWSVLHGFARGIFHYSLKQTQSKHEIIKKVLGIETNLRLNWTTLQKSIMVVTQHFLPQKIKMWSEVTQTFASE